jgi:hypothetical protein
LAHYLGIGIYSGDVELAAELSCGV